MSTPALSFSQSVPASWALSRSPATAWITFFSEFITTFTTYTSPRALAAAIISLWIGLFSKFPVLAYLLSINSELWLYMIVFLEQQPGNTDFLPPENPAKKCGSMNPSATRRSASAAILFTTISPPEGSFSSRVTSISSSSQSWI